MRKAETDDINKLIKLGENKERAFKTKCKICGIKKKWKGSIARVYSNYKENAKKRD